MPTKNSPDKKENPILLISLIFIVSISLVYLVFHLLKIYQSVIPEGDVHAYYGAMGDFIGGLINPTLTFITIYLLIVTLRQNQKVITQGQEINSQNNTVIELNIEELKNSTKELRLSQEALHKDATTNATGSGLALCLNEQPWTNLHIGAVGSGAVGSGLAFCLRARRKT